MSDTENNTDEIYGSPRIFSVYDRIRDLEEITSSSEKFFKNGGSE